MHVKSVSESSEDSTTSSSSSSSTEEASASSVVDPRRLPELRISFQQKLIRLLHSRKCLEHDIEALGRHQLRKKCHWPHCGKMKQVLIHTRNCSDDHSCTFRHCIAYRFVLDHWDECKKSDCFFCKDLYLDNNHNHSHPESSSVQDAKTAGQSHETTKNLQQYLLRKLQNGCQTVAPHQPRLAVCS